MIRTKTFTKKLLNLQEHIVEKIKHAEVLLIGCSAGGFNLVFDLVLQLPANYPLTVIIVIHRSKKFKSSLEELLNRKAKVPVRLVQDKEPIKKGYVYFATSDYHLLIEPDHIFSLDFSDPVLFCRPSIDITFKSAADIFGEKVISILLSGANEDGADGTYFIGKKGGLTVVQDPASAEVSTMPQAAINRGEVDLVLNNSDIFELVTDIPAILNR